MKILKVDKDKVQVELTKEEAVDAIFKFCVFVPKRRLTKKMKRILLENVN